jgi:hypothetical protein
MLIGFQSAMVTAAPALQSLQQQFQSTGQLAQGDRHNTKPYRQGAAIADAGYDFVVRYYFDPSISIEQKPVY